MSSIFCAENAVVFRFFKNIQTLPAIYYINIIVMKKAVNNETAFMKNLIIFMNKTEFRTYHWNPASCKRINILE